MSGSLSPAVGHLALLALTAGIAAAAPRWHQVPCSYRIGCVAMKDDSTGWAAGTVGTRRFGMLRYDGRDWILVDTIRDQLIYDICFAEDTAWAVGEQFNFPDGVVYKCDGEHWTQQPDPFDRTLQAVAFPSKSVGFAGGASPVQHHPVMTYRGGAWRLDSSLTTSRVVLGLWATHQNKCIAVGDSGAVFHFDRDTWISKRPLTGQHLRRVAFESNTEGWAVGNRGTILRCFKDTWAIAPSPTTRNLYGLSIAATSGEAWAVGDSGTILHMVNDSWVVDPFIPSPAHCPLYSVSFSSADNGWAFGYSFTGEAVALHYFDDSVGVAEPRPSIPSEPELQCCPNPLPCRAPLRIIAPGAGSIEIRDALGRLVWTGTTPEGPVVWDGRDACGRETAAGCYFVGSSASPSARFALIRVGWGRR